MPRSLFGRYRWSPTRITEAAAFVNQYITLPTPLRVLSEKKNGSYAVTATEQRRHLDSTPQPVDLARRHMPRDLRYHLL